MRKSFFLGSTIILFSELTAAAHNRSESFSSLYYVTALDVIFYPASDGVAVTLMHFNDLSKDH